MSSSDISLEQRKRLAAGWRETGRLLEIQRRTELATQTPEESRRAAFDMLQLGGLLPPDPARERGSGLIDMQRLFARGRSRGRD
jgi:hypothetical protein